MDEGYCLPDSASSSDAYWLLLQVLSLIPLWHYLLLAAFLLLSVLYNFLQLHFFQDLFSGFPGSPVLLSYNTSSQIYHAVVSQCEVLRGRYFATPWLCSPNLQTLFLNYFGRPPLVKYARSFQPFSTTSYLFIGTLDRTVEDLKIDDAMISFVSGNCLGLLMVEPLPWIGCSVLMVCIIKLLCV